MSVAGDSLLVADRLAERLAQGDADILDRVVIVDMQVAFRLDVEVDQAVAGHLIQHVLEKVDAGVEAALALAIQIDGHGDTGLQRIAGDGGAAHSFCIRHNVAPGYRTPWPGFVPKGAAL